MSPSAKMRPADDINPPRLIKLDLGVNDADWRRARRDYGPPVLHGDRNSPLIFWRFPSGMTMRSLPSPRAAHGVTTTGLTNFRSATSRGFDDHFTVFLVVLRLITSSNSVGCRTGRSAGTVQQCPACGRPVYRLTTAASTPDIEALLDEHVDVVALTHWGRAGMARRVVD